MLYKLNKYMINKDILFKKLLILNKANKLVMDRQNLLLLIFSNLEI
jgi:hypothetical protein